MDDEDRGLPSTIKEQPQQEFLEGSIKNSGTSTTINNVSMVFADSGGGGSAPQVSNVSNITPKAATNQARRSSSKASSRSSSTESRTRAVISPKNLQQTNLVPQQQQPTNILLNTFQPSFLPFSISSLSNGLASTQTFTFAGPAIKPAAGNAGSAIIATPQQTLQFGTGATAGANAQPTMTVMPQSLIMSAGGGLQSNVPQFVLAPNGAMTGQTIGGGPMFQIVQQPMMQTAQNGLIQHQPTIVAVPSTPSTNNNKANSRSLPRPIGAKQILPKVSTSTTTSTTTAPTCSMSHATSQAGGVRLIQTQPNTNTFVTQNVPATQQFVLNTGGQGMTGGAQIITNSQGTFIVPGGTFANAQQPQFVIQGPGNSAGGVSTVQPQMQFAVRPAMAGGVGAGQQTVFVNSNNAVGNQPQTFVINSTGSTTQTPANNLVMNPNGAGAVRCQTPSFIIRPPAQQILSQSNGQQIVSQQQQPQFTVLQTPNGPVLVQLQQPQSQPQPPQQQPQTLQVGNTIISLATPSSAANNTGNVAMLPTVINQNNALVQTSTSSSVLDPLPANSTALPSVTDNEKIETKTTTANNTKDNSMILADLLKETGILSETSPPTSPKINASQANVSAAAGEPINSVQPQQPTVLMMPGVAGGTQQILLAPSARPPVVQQQQQPLRLTVAPDGTLLLLPPAVGLVNQLPAPPQQAETTTKPQIVDPSGLGSSQPSPDSTTPSIEVSSSMPATAVADASVINTKSKTNESIATTIETTPMMISSKVTTIAAAIDGSNLVKIASKPIGTTQSQPVIISKHPQSLSTVSASSFLTIVDQSGVILTQINSANNQQIGELIEQQILFLTTCNELNQSQKELLQELTNLKTKLTQIKSIANVSLVQSISTQAQQVLRLTPNIQTGSGGSNQQSIAIATGPNGQIIITKPQAQGISETVAGSSADQAAGGNNLIKPTLNLITVKSSTLPGPSTSALQQEETSSANETSETTTELDEETKQLITILKA